MKFGVQIENHLGFSYNAVLNIALEAERLGYDGLFICDHLVGRNEETRRQPCLDTWVTLGALASATKNIQLGTLVSAVGFRYPSILAKMGATVDAISGGRLQLGIGAGWYEPEYTAYGIPFPRTGERIQQLREAIQIIKMMWTQDRSTFSGRDYKIREAWCVPKPSQPRIWVGGTGEQSMLRVVAELGDGWNATGTTAEEYESKMKVLESYCSRAGRKLGEIERSYYAPCLVAKAEDKLVTKFKQHYHQFKRQDENMEAFAHRVRDSSRSFIGTADEVIGKIEKFAKLGVTYLIFYFPDKDHLGLMRDFSESVLPTFA